MARMAAPRKPLIAIIMPLSVTGLGIVAVMLALLTVRAFGNLRELAGLQRDSRLKTLAYSRSAVVDTQTALYSIGLFSSVRVEPDQETEDPVVPVKIAVTQVTKNELSWGFGFGLDPLSYSVRGRLQYIRHGVITPLTTSKR